MTRDRWLIVVALAILLALAITGDVFSLVTQAAEYGVDHNY